MKRTVLVTGASGYLGRRLVPRLVARGHAVRAAVREGSRLDLPCPLVPTDVLDPEGVRVLGVEEIRRMRLG